MGFITQLNGVITMNVLRNKYVTDVNGELCVQNQSNLENPYPGLKNILNQDSPSDEYRYSYKLETNKYLYQDSDNMMTPPIALLGDLDLDGIMDLVLVVTDQDAGNKVDSRVIAYQGEKCTLETAKYIFGKT